MDIVLDSNYLADFLAQYFDPNCARRGEGKFLPRGNVSARLANKLNGIVSSSRERIGDLVLSSTLAFVEVARRWNDIVGDRFSVEQMHAFLCQPPDWFDVAPVDEDLLPSFAGVPAFVAVGSQLRHIEWTDAVHLATVFSRGADATMATSDTHIKIVLLSQRRSIL